MWILSESSGARCFRGRGTASASERRDCAHVGKGSRGGSSIAASSMVAEEESRTRRTAASMP